MKKIINGELVDLTPEDIAQRQADIAAHEASKEEQSIKKEKEDAVLELKKLAETDLLEKHIEQLKATGTAEQKQKIAQLEAKKSTTKKDK